MPGVRPSFYARRHVYIKPRAPRLNGKVERSRGTDDIEFYQLLNASCCPDCLKGFEAISSPICACCGMMFKGHADDNHLCGDCLTRPKKFRMARAAMVYDHHLMAVIHRFKYAGKTGLAKPLGRLILGAYLRYWHHQKVDLILPVPLHPKKMRQRGFNQSFLLMDTWKSISQPMVGELKTIPLKQLFERVSLPIRPVISSGFCG